MRRTNFQYARGLGLIETHLANENTLALDVPEREELAQLNDVEVRATETGDERTLDRVRQRRLSIQGRVLARLTTGGRAFASRLGSSAEEAELATETVGFLEDAVANGTVAEIWPDLLTAISN